MKYLEVSDGEQELEANCHSDNYATADEDSIYAKILSALAKKFDEREDNLEEEPNACSSTSQQVELNPRTQNINMWTYEQSSDLIRVMSNYLADPNDLMNIKKRKDVFESVANDLISDGFAVTASTVQKKWKSLVKSYKRHKKSGIGSGQCKFVFFDIMDNIMSPKLTVHNDNVDNHTSTHEDTILYDKKKNAEQKDGVIYGKDKESSEIEAGKSNDMKPLNIKKSPTQNISNGWKNDEMVTDEIAKLIEEAKKCLEYLKIPKPQNVESNKPLDIKKIPTKNIHVWDYDQTTKLIKVISKYLEDVEHPEEREEVFKLVTKELNIQGLAVDTSAVKSRWNNLFRRYTKSKTKTRNDQNQSKFIFFNAMDEILGSSSNHSGRIGNTIHHAIKENKEKINICKDKDNSEIESVANDSKKPKNMKKAQNIHVWSYDETSKLIEVMSKYLEDVWNPVESWKVFELVAKDLNTQGSSVNALLVKNKWRNLFKKYIKYQHRTPIDRQSRFIFFNAMDDIILGPRSTPTVKVTPVWTYDETCKLIEIMSNYLEDWKNPEKRESVFNLVTSDMKSYGIVLNATSVENKWKSLVSNYRILKATGIEPLELMNFDKMDEILGHDPTFDFILADLVTTNHCGVSDKSDIVQEEKIAGEIHHDKKRGGMERISEMTLSSDYLAIKRKEYANRQKRHEELMEIERRKLKIMEDLLTLYKK